MRPSRRRVALPQPARVYFSELPGDVMVYQRGKDGFELVHGPPRESLRARWLHLLGKSLAQILGRLAAFVDGLERRPLGGGRNDW